VRAVVSIFVRVVVSIFNMGRLSLLISKHLCRESLERIRKELATTGDGRSDQMLLGDRVRLADEIAAI
jgi:hypothetical protein